MKLNLSKYAFRVALGKFFGLMVFNRGIVANLKKLKVVYDMSPPKMVKDIQCLTGRIMALSRFISKSAKCCLPFF